MMLCWRKCSVSRLAVTLLLVLAIGFSVTDPVLAQSTEPDTTAIPEQAVTDPSATPVTPSIHVGKSKEQLLAELRDIYSPAAPTWWPPAPGWWIAFGLLLVLLAASIRFIRQRLKFRRENNWKKSATHLYKQLCERASEGKVPSTSIIADASVLMRRVVLTQEPREHTASLTDDQWLAVLDKIGQTNEYSQGAGRLLTRHPYMRPQDIDRNELDALLNLIKTTIDRAKNTLITPQPGLRKHGLTDRESGIV